MKILLINSYDNYGGASLACVRLLNAFEKQAGVEVKLLTQIKHINNTKIAGIAESNFQKKLVFARFAWERLQFYWQEKNKSVRFAFSPANVGVDISQHPWVQEADILHLHWINFGFLSLKSLEKLFKLGKPIVWTLHDMWTFTGGCHYAGECTNFQKMCGNCPMLKSPQPSDWSYQIFQKKFRLFHQYPIHLVTCSAWLANLAQQSSLFKRSTNSTKQFSIQNIPNPIDTEAFRPIDKTEARAKLNLPQDKFLLLFGAMNIADQRKGFVYLQEALKHLKNEGKIEMELVVFGKAKPEMLENLPFKVHHLGVLQGSENLALAYSAANTFVLPSLEDNLPNTVMEALACGTPCVAFKTGGVPEMIDNQIVGYLAEFKNTQDLAQGISWLYEKYSTQSIDYQQITNNARRKVLKQFNEIVVSKQYLALYQKIRTDTK